MSSRGIQKDFDKLVQWGKHPLMICFMITCALFGFSLSYDPFIFDDYFHVFGNTKVLSNEVKNWLYYIQNSLTPIPFLFWKVVALFSPEGNPYTFRFFNLVFHSLNTYLVYLLSQHVFSKLDLKQTGLPWLAALFYLLHPTQVESVVWVSSQRTLLATLFSLWATFLFLRNEEKREQGSTHPLITHFPSFLLILLGLLSNPSIAPVIFLGPLLLFHLSGKKTPYLLWFVGVLFLTVILFVSLHLDTTMTKYFTNLSLWIRIQIIFTSLTVYFLNLLFPFQISFDYQVNAFVVSYLEEIRRNMFLITLGPLIFLSSFSLYLKKETKTAGFFLLLFFLLLSPHCGLILHDFNNISVVSDRYLNLALFPFSLFFAYTLHHFDQKFAPKFEKIPTLIIPLGLFLSLSFLTFYQVKKWDDTEKLLRSSNILTEIRPSSLVALANHYRNNQNYTQARIAFKSALALDQDNTAAILGLLSTLEVSPKESEKDFILKYIEVNPITITENMYAPLIRIYLRDADLKEARVLLKSMKQTSLNQRLVSVLEAEIKTTASQFLVKRLKELETYFSGINRFDEAIEYAQKQLEFYPGNTTIKQRLKEYYEEKLKNRKKEAQK